MNVELSILQLPSGEPFTVGIDVPVKAPSFALQKLENFTLLFIEQGSARIELDFCTYALEAGRHIGLAVGLYFQCLETSADFIVSYITFTRDILSEVAARFNPSFFAFLNKYPLSPSLPEERIEGNRLILQVVGNIYKEKGHTFRLSIFKNFLQSFLMDIYDKTKARFLHRHTSNTTRQEELLERFIALTFQHSGTHREVRFYADRMCITTRYLSSIVQNLTGHSPKELVDARCIQEIKMQLRTTNKSIQEIAFQLNFPDQPFFTRYFKKHTGVSPAAYRQKQMN